MVTSDQAPDLGPHLGLAREGAEPQGAEAHWPPPLAYEDAGDPCRPAAPTAERRYETGFGRKRPADVGTGLGDGPVEPIDGKGACRRERGHEAIGFSRRPSRENALGKRMALDSRSADAATSVGINCLGSRRVQRDRPLRWRHTPDGAGVYMGTPRLTSYGSSPFEAFRRRISSRESRWSARGRKRSLDSRRNADLHPAPTGTSLGGLEASQAIHHVRTQEPKRVADTGWLFKDPNPPRAGLRHLLGYLRYGAR
jgi:hypothetical protein